MSADETLLPSLACTGLGPDDIDIVVNSHFHPDHCGCNQFFRKATILAHAKEIEAARAPGAEAAGYLKADWDYGQPIEAVNGEKDLFGDSSVVLVPLPGHTPGIDRRAGQPRSRRAVPARVGLRQPAPAPRHGCGAAQHLERRATVEDVRRRSAGSRRAVPPSSAAMTTSNGRACAREARAMSSDRRAQSSDVLRPKNVGAPIKRTEDPRLLTGNGEYTADRKPDRPLHLAFLRSGQPHARIVRIDTAAARGAPGVVAVFTAEDIAERLQAGDPVLADAELLRDADPASRFREGPLRRRGRRRRRRHLALSRRGRARTDRGRLRAARRDCRAPSWPSPTMRPCCTKRPAPTC